MDALRLQLTRIVELERLLAVARALVILAIGLVIARLVGRAVGGIFARRGSAQQVMLARRVVTWAIGALTLMTALDHLGFDLSVLLGAAGVLTVAVGFASQTSASNLISGLFLIFERPFVVGDVITVGGRTGEVLAMDLFAVRLRTFDNLLVRIPNESVLKSEIVNVTYYPIRRIDIKVGVDYGTDLTHVRDVLLEVADKNPRVFDEPKPIVVVEGFGDSAIQLQFSIWATRENFLEVKNGITEELKEAFERAGIKIPYPHRAVATDQPIPVRVVAAG